MREADRRTIEEIGLPGVVLMENAGAAVARVVRRAVTRRPAARSSSAARATTAATASSWRGGCSTSRPATCLVGRATERAGRRARPPERLRALRRGRSREVARRGGLGARARPRCARADLIVDALLGTGLREEPTGLVAARPSPTWRARPTGGTPVVAVDMPSGAAVGHGRRRLADGRADGDGDVRGPEARPRAAARLRPGRRAAWSPTSASARRRWSQAGPRLCPARGRGRGARLSRARAPAAHKGDLRPPAGRRGLGREDGRRGPGGHRRAALGRRPGDGGDPGAGAGPRGRGRGPR